MVRLMGNYFLSKKGLANWGIWQELILRFTKGGRLFKVRAY